jgi:CRISPR-associated protein (TIGR02584 family)
LFPQTSRNSKQSARHACGCLTSRQTEDPFVTLGLSGDVTKYEANVAADDSPASERIDPRASAWLPWQRNWGAVIRRKRTGEFRAERKRQPTEFESARLPSRKLADIPIALFLRHDSLMPSRRILLAVTGLTPQVITETLYVLALQRVPAWVPDEVHLVTTTSGADNARLNLLSGAAWFRRLCADYGLPPIRFDADHIHVLGDGRGMPLDDIRTPEENTRAADYITEWVRRFTADPTTELHVSIAGGRKTMGYYLGYALSLFGRAQDRLSHVLVSDPFETNRDFYYPMPYDHPIHSKRGEREITVNARDARVDLADIPFVRLRAGLPEKLLEGTAQFSEAVAAAQCGPRPLSLVIDLAERRAWAGGEALKLTAQNLALLVWLARRRHAGLPPIQCSNKQPSLEAAREFLTVCREICGAHASETERAETALAHGMDSTWFSPAKNRLHQGLIRALGETDAQPYFIRGVGARREARFELALDRTSIELRA